MVTAVTVTGTALAATVDPTFPRPAVAAAFAVHLAVSAVCSHQVHSTGGQR